jgi:hypothetical protein
VKQHLLTASQISEREIGVSVPVERAQALWEFFKAHNIEVTPLADAVFQVRNYYVDEDGRKVSDQFAVVREFRAFLSPSRFDDLIGEWLKKG